MFNNTRDTYDFVNKTLHWTVALIIFGLLLLGFYLDELSYSANQFILLNLHKSFGLLILWLAALRIIWHRISKKPATLSAHAKWEKILAKITHIFLYFALIGMPLSGWIMSMSGGYEVSFFGIKMPSYIGKNTQINDISWAIHQILAYSLIGGIFMHVTGAFKHHFIDKDLTLNRMVFFPQKLFLPIIIAVLFIFIAGLIRLYIF